MDLRNAPDDVGVVVQDLFLLLEGYGNRVLADIGADDIGHRRGLGQGEGLASHQPGLARCQTHLLPEAFQVVEADESPTATGQGADAPAQAAGAADLLQLPAAITDLAAGALLDAHLHVLRVGARQRLLDTVLPVLLRHGTPQG